jgi:parvulin-like peptidyl-prolyl isomerase
MTRHKIKDKRKVGKLNLKTLVLIFFIGIFNLFCHFPKLYAQDKIIAVVNKEIITQKDLDNFLNFMRIQLSQQYKEEKLEEKIQAIRTDSLQRLIEDRLILQEAKKNKIKTDDSRIKGQINQIKGKYNSEREFQNALKEQGLVEADLVSRIKEQLLMFNIIEIKVRDKIVVSPAEITDYYNKNSVKFITREQRDFQSLLIESQETAGNIYNDLKAGKDINELAQANSLKVNALSVFRGELKKELEDVLFKLDTSEITQPIKIKDKFYLFKLIKTIPPKQNTMAEVQDTIYNSIYENKMQEAMVKWVDGLKKSAYIKIVQ